MTMSVARSMIGSMAPRGRHLSVQPATSIRRPNHGPGMEPPSMVVRFSKHDLLRRRQNAGCRLPNQETTPLLIPPSRAGDREAAMAKQASTKTQGAGTDRTTDAARAATDAG